MNLVLYFGIKLTTRKLKLYMHVFNHFKNSVSGDDKFIYWLRDCREAGRQVSLGQVKAKVTEILSTHGQADVEKTCKWFLLWHNRYNVTLHPLITSITTSFPLIPVLYCITLSVVVIWLFVFLP